MPTGSLGTSSSMGMPLQLFVELLFFVTNPTNLVSFSLHCSTSLVFFLPIVMCFYLRPVFTACLTFVAKLFYVSYSSSNCVLNLFDFILLLSLYLIALFCLCTGTHSIGAWGTFVFVAIWRLVVLLVSLALLCLLCIALTCFI